ncbi:MAG: hypothetical protein JNK24_08715, partial [Alphaproteobacteria bacterium]|nr:hypothetical protein [Alphaproteobacteria bacterium]
MVSAQKNLAFARFWATSFGCRIASLLLFAFTFLLISNPAYALGFDFDIGADFGWSSALYDYFGGLKASASLTLTTAIGSISIFFTTGTSTMFAWITSRTGCGTIITHTEGTVGDV